MYVQYGCGFSTAPGWENFDASPTLRFEKLPIIGLVYTKNARRFPNDARYGDIVRGLPIAPGSVAGLYASHVLEHLSLADCRTALANSYKLLRKGGVFRLIVPDLAERIRLYLETDRAVAADEFMRLAHLGLEQKRTGIRARIFEAFANNRHLWMYDEASMTRELSSAGFSDIRRCSFGDSSDPMFSRVEEEKRFNDGVFRELAMECRRLT